jgi:DNA-binding XRE family transcriptional regulator
MNIENKIPARIAIRNAVGHISFGDFLNSYRVGNEYSQVGFAKKLKISKQDLCNIEKGRKIVSVERAAKFAKLLQMPEMLFIKYVIEDQLKKAGIKLEISFKKAA